LLEAFAASVPVVASAVGGTPELVEEGVSGYLVPAGDAGKLAEAVRRALAGDEHLRELGFHGRQRVLECFSFRAQVERYLALFAEVCKPVRPGAPAPAAIVPPPPVEAEPTCKP
jgi:glycosyltransferase involved in cell wall biosynthesis